MCKLRSFIFLLLASFVLSGCAWLGMDNPFNADPLTGGVDASTCRLLGVGLPAGFQLYPSHGYVENGASGQPAGLETYRGNASVAHANVAMFNSLKAAGWKLELALRKGDRAVTLYRRDSRLALVAFHRQGMLTIMEIWAGEELPPDAVLGLDAEPDQNDGNVEMAGEEYGPLGEDEKEPAPGSVEKWGKASTLEEREL